MANLTTAPEPKTLGMKLTLRSGDFKVAEIVNAQVLPHGELHISHSDGTSEFYGEGVWMHLRAVPTQD